MGSSDLQVQLCAHPESESEEGGRRVTALEGGRAGVDRNGSLRSLEVIMGSFVTHLIAPKRTDMLPSRVVLRTEAERSFESFARLWLAGWAPGRYCSCSGRGRALSLGC